MSAMVPVEHVIEGLNLIAEPLEELLDTEVRAHEEGVVPEDEDPDVAYVQLWTCADAFLKLHRMKSRMESAALIAAQQEEA